MVGVKRRVHGATFWPFGRLPAVSKGGNGTHSVSARSCNMSALSNVVAKAENPGLEPKVAACDKCKFPVLTGGTTQSADTCILGIEDVFYCHVGHSRRGRLHYRVHFNSRAETSVTSDATCIWQRKDETQLCQMRIAVSPNAIIITPIGRANAVAPPVPLELGVTDPLAGIVVDDVVSG